MLAVPKGGSREPKRLFDKPADPAGSPSDFAWSPDGKQLAVTVQKLLPEDCWQMETYRVEADGSGRTRLPIPDTDCRIVQLDQEGREGKERAIYRIWPDFPVEAFIDRSISTIKADAAAG